MVPLNLTPAERNLFARRLAAASVKATADDLAGRPALRRPLGWSTWHHRAANGVDVITPADDYYRVTVAQTFDALEALEALDGRRNV